LLSGCHDGVLGFGSDLAFEKRLQGFGGNVLAQGGCCATLFNCQAQGYR